jgi:hypothetical protein
VADSTASHQTQNKEQSSICYFHHSLVKSNDLMIDPGLEYCLFMHRCLKTYEIMKVFFYFIEIQVFNKIKYLSSKKEKKKSRVIDM